jgi:hypothetical protein
VALYPKEDTCLLNLEDCSTGFTLAVGARLEELTENTFLLTTGKEYGLEAVYRLVWLLLVL